MRDNKSLWWGSPHIRSVPLSGFVMPVSIRNNVVLPAPLGPSNPTIWPDPTSKSKGANA